MLTLRRYLASLVFILLVCVQPVLADSNDYQQYAVYKNQNLTITSYSSKWDYKKLESLYAELLNNIHSDEINKLSNISLYPDSKDGVNGYYNEDIFWEKGSLVSGYNASIDLFNCDRYDSIEKIAPILSHEYGHHYTISNIIDKEGVYYDEQGLIEYSKLRNLKNYPINYGHEEDYYHFWDVAEILAEDYVQLLGSDLAKKSTDFKDLKERLFNGDYDDVPLSQSFNIKPQENVYMPLATEVDGLYEYFLEIGGLIGLSPQKPYHVSFSGIKVFKNFNNEYQFKISWNKDPRGKDFEYTIIMYPITNPLAPIPIKTVKQDEEMSAVFGSGEFINKNNDYFLISNVYEGVYQFKVYLKDNNGFIYSSDTMDFDFSNIPQNLVETYTIFREEPESEKTNDISNNEYNNVDTDTNINESSTEATSEKVVPDLQDNSTSNENQNVNQPETNIVSKPSTIQGNTDKGTTDKKTTEKNTGNRFLNSIKDFVTKKTDKVSNASKTNTPSKESVVFGPSKSSTLQESIRAGVNYISKTRGGAND